MNDGSPRDDRPPDVAANTDRDMWRCRAMQESTPKVDPGLSVDNDGNRPPVVHVDSDAPLHDADGRLVVADDFRLDRFERGRHLVSDHPYARAGQMR